MGNIVSRAKLIFGALVIINKTLDTLSERIKRSPGLPVPNPSLPYWTVPKTPISSEQKSLPTYADIVVIGSGITGTSFAYHALQRDNSLRIVMLEARDVCSGATGRNGGHINPPLYGDWKQLKERYGEAMAKLLIKFRLAHVREMHEIASTEDIMKECQVRETEHLEVYSDKDAFNKACEELKVWKASMAKEAEDFVAHEGKEAATRFSLSKSFAGCIAGPGGAMHPYRFVTLLLNKLLERHTDRFSIATHTPCTSIKAPNGPTPYYTVITPNSTILTPHVVHATNGWTSHLVEPMREKIIPVRGTMSAQRPGTALSPATLDGQRSYVFYPGGLGYDYLTQLPTGEHELMFGGGWASAYDSAAADIGFADDSDFSAPVASHLAGALPLYFDGHWGREKVPVTMPEDGVRWPEGRTKAQWGGILGISADGLPWVGRLPQKLTTRAAPPVSSTPHSKEGSSAILTAAPGEWISAGYTGEGMVHAWMCGKALAGMVMDAEDDIRSWFPEILRITEERWKKATPEDYLARRLGGLYS